MTAVTDAMLGAVFILGPMIAYLLNGDKWAAEKERSKVDGRSRNT